MRPRIGGRRGQVPYQRAPLFRQSVLTRVQQRLSRAAGGSGTSRRWGTVGATADVPRPGVGARRCAIKARVVQLRGGSSALAGARLHLDYIERDGVEKDGSEGRLYSDRQIDRETLRAALPGEKHQFRFIVSPEDGAAVDLAVFARDLMAQVERDTGRQLIWGAVNHHDTDNPHVHIVVRGVDRAGKEVRIEPAYISERMRWQAQHLLTRELGVRTALEVKQQLRREITQERFTSIDRALAQLVTPDRSVDVRRLAQLADPNARARLTARLQVLASLALAEPARGGSWKLVDGWDQRLKALGDRGDIVKRIHAALRGGGDPGRYSVVSGTKDHPPFEGVVRRKGLHDELTGNMYAVVETPRGHAHYVQIDAETADTLREGAIVRVMVSREAWAKKADRVLTEVAAGANGIYDPAAHQRHLAARPLRIAGKSVDAADVVAANRRRLERLERYKLVERLPNGTWRVPGDLVQVLEERERSHPRFRTRVQVLAKGLGDAVQKPTFLVGVDPISRAPYGFGAEVARALRQAKPELPRGVNTRQPTRPRGPSRGGE